MNRKNILLASCVLLCWAGSALGQTLPAATRPEDVGFSPERLARIATFYQGEIDKGAIPGATLLISREGKIAYSQALGYQDREKHIAMKPDTIFRIASMTKPITSVAIMMLAEEGKIDLIAPVAQYLPEFKGVKVGVEKTDPATDKAVLALEDPKRPMTTQDLLGIRQDWSTVPLATRWFTRLTTRSIYSTTARRWRSSSPNCRNFRWRTSPARCGSTACQSTCSAESSK
jgi:CubicO group peptidase (beta-lactamase class C family)